MLRASTDLEVAEADLLARGKATAISDEVERCCETDDRKRLHQIVAALIRIRDPRLC